MFATEIHSNSMPLSVRLMLARFCSLLSFLTIEIKLYDIVLRAARDIVKVYCHEKHSGHKLFIINISILSGYIQLCTIKI